MSKTCQITDTPRAERERLENKLNFKLTKIVDYTLQYLNYYHNIFIYLPRGLSCVRKNKHDVDVLNSVKNNLLS